MYIKRNFNLTLIYFFTWRILLYSFLMSLLALLCYDVIGWKWVAIPWLPVSLIGTAVSFYVGFKNSQSYDRLWEARKVWGGITNMSRAFATAVRAFITDDFATIPISPERLEQEKKTLIYRHIAWLYALKHLMWERTAWEHQRNTNAWYRSYFEKKFAFGTWEGELTPYLDSAELQWLTGKKNPAVQLLDRQSQHLAQLRKDGLLEDYRHMELQKFITELLAEQGRSERIKNFPFPRHFATTSMIFIWLFVFLLPFGLVSEFARMGDDFIWLLIPSNMIVSWVFASMELNGDYSENPFEGLVNDVPIFTIIRNIEIDLKDMLGETDLPEKVQPVHDVLL